MLEINDSCCMYSERYHCGNNKAAVLMVVHVSAGLPAPPVTISFCGSGVPGAKRGEDAAPTRNLVREKLRSGKMNHFVSDAKRDRVEWINIGLVHVIGISLFKDIVDTGGHCEMIQPFIVAE